jgi:DMSO/TMAO reductase YedYZ molybdopterin-dependent catalytic subunit
VDAEGRPIRFNGDVGLLESVDPVTYRLKLSGAGLREPVELTLDDVRKLPATTESFEFKCIEGWSAPVSCKGVRFSRLLEHLGVKGGFAYAGMTSVDGEYYVSWDAESLLHSQTLLCYEMNGAPLRPENGAPLRVLSPVKYGVKQIKQVGEIALAQAPPPDYWAEQGYDDYLGL